MFGYVRPLRTELRVREFDEFKAVYCALCHTLGKKYGAASRFILNYDFTFLAMLLWTDEGCITFERKRCIVSPLRKKCICCQARPLEECAGYSVILAWWKMRDSIADDGFFRSLPARLASMFLKGAYKKARREFSDFDETVSLRIKELSELEKGGCSSLDMAADKFAQMLRAAYPPRRDKLSDRALGELLYHLGRWIYIVDAYADLEEDASAERYNAVAARFTLRGGKAPEDVRESIRLTLSASLGQVSAAFELMPETRWSEILRNIIYLGMPAVAELVLDGRFKNTRDGIPR